jgi:acetyl-CoA/propionyl-CoA carboxylase carboxyl transferase subunit
MAADAAASPTAALPRDPVARMAALFDSGTLSLLSAVDDSGAVAGTGLIDGSMAVAFASDPRVRGGASGPASCAVIVSAYEEAVARGVPIIGLWHSGGARIADGVASLDGVGQVFAAMTMASGVVPQISVVLGPAAGGAAYGPALTDIVILSAPRSGDVVHLVASSDDDALGYARSLVSLLSDQGKITPESVASRDLSGLLPESARHAYDVHGIVSRLLDEGSGIELHPRWAPNVVTTLGRFGGRTVGVVANNPMRLDGCLDADSAEKAARFVRFCDAFGVPLIVLVDVPGYLPGVGQEWDGVVRRGAKLLHAFAECVVPRVTLVTRKAIGGAYIAMNSRSLGATRVYAWPDAEVAVGGLSRAIEIGVLDEVISPAGTTSALAAAIADAPPARGAHANIPL